MEALPETLRENVRLLGELLGDTVRDHEGEDLFQKIEDIRQLGKAIQQSEDEDSTPLVERLEALDDKDAHRASLQPVSEPRQHRRAGVFRQRRS